MKTSQELAEWCAGALIEFGDPAAPVGQMFFRYTEVTLARGDELTCTARGDALMLNVGGVPPLRVDVEGPAFDEEERLRVFGIKSIVPGLWTLEPSLNLPGMFHAFIVIYDVPNPAPWERLIVL